MKMYKELNELESFTVDQFQENFDALIERVENGESFIIKDGQKNAVIVPYNEKVEFNLEPVVDDELIRLHTEHEEGS
jgi:antitoxin (DNA-binding transcriptional repressor) of toxin-antitoxin stability system